MNTTARSGPSNCPEIRAQLVAPHFGVPEYASGANPKRSAATAGQTECGVVVCSGTGGSTTTILRTLTAQLLHHGAHALVLALKRISHRWASGVPGVTYCREIAADGRDQVQPAPPLLASPPAPLTRRAGSLACCFPAAVSGRRV
ncbi:hypothetical protein ABCR94_14220 [Streptomyces sp. 21So2-11]|uniref:hypothetical protein n=1 Tax=Streptomyces sp. 21So2-11 TaxID=3144408 RepID=UPI003219F94E